MLEKKDAMLHQAKRFLEELDTENDEIREKFELVVEKCKGLKKALKTAQTENKKFQEDNLELKHQCLA